MEKVNEKVAKALGVPVDGMPRLGGGSEGRKILLFGPSASGKTFGLVDLIAHGERLLVISTEQGGNGLDTVRNELARRGTPELFEERVRILDPKTHEQTQRLFSKTKVDGKYQPQLYFDYPEIKDFRPTTLVWEGLTDFQDTQVHRHLVGDQDIADVYADARHYWGDLGKHTSLMHGDFLNLTDPDYDWNHILTVHEKEVWATDDKGNRVKGATKPLKITYKLSGSFDPKAAYDLVIRVRRDTKTDLSNPMGAPLVIHTYQVTAGAEKADVKKRGYDLPDEFPADMVRVWKQVKGEK